MRNQKRTYVSFILALLASLSLVFAGCSGNGTETTAAATTPVITTEATTETTVETTITETTTGDATEPVAAGADATAGEEASEVNCTFSISCQAAVDKGYLEDGIILDETSLTLKPGATIYDALVEATEAAGIPVISQTSSYGLYIVGINSLSEGDCGASSGWGYTVNGEYPMNSCDTEVINEGDVIVFDYYVG